MLRKITYCLKQAFYRTKAHLQPLPIEPKCHWLTGEKIGIWYKIKTPVKIFWNTFLFEWMYYPNLSWSIKNRNAK